MLIMVEAAGMKPQIEAAVRDWSIPVIGSGGFDSLTANAYGMYLIHYAFVSWLQLALLRIAMSGLAKGVLVTVATIALSWATTSALRRIPAVARLI